MLNALFVIPVALYFAATILQFAGITFKKEPVKKAAWLLLVGAAVIQTVYIIVRGVKAGRVPMANQFEFANAFAWGVAVIGIFFKVRGRKKMDWMVTLCAPCAFLLISYAAFALAACMGIRYLALEKKEDEKHLKQLDSLSYKLVSFGFLMLTVVILTGCIWAEQAWGSFWTWDPKEVWALITWIVYAIYLHQRVRMNWRGHKMAVFAIGAFVFVMFTFVGVNTLMSGLHSYA